MNRILIAEDEALVRISLCRFLQNEGYSCEGVENGARALEWVLNHEVDLVLTDNQMPVMSGLELLESLQTRPFFNSPQIIFMTGHPGEALQKKALQTGACAVLLKPFNTNELLMTVNKVLAGTKKEKQYV